MGIFGGGGNNSPQRVNNIQMTQSTQGNPVPWGMGQFKVHQSLLWMDDLQPILVSQGKGGKGGGGKGGGGDYLYYADMDVCLCSGPIMSIANLWSDQSWYNTANGNETVTVSQVYAPSNSAILLADNGVALTNTYSNTYTDYGAPASTVLSGSDGAPMQLIPWYSATVNYAVGNQVFNGFHVYTCLVANTGQAVTNATYWHDTGAGLATGQYSVNPASIGTFTVTSVANASGGNTVYTGTFTGGVSPYTSGASSAYVNFAFVIAGFTNATANNGTFVCVASSATSVTLNNPNGVAETHAATAQETGNTYHFSTSDVGKTSIVNYQFKLTEFFYQEQDLIPAGQVLYPGAMFWPQIDRGVIYYNNGDSRDGKALTAVSGTPTVTGTYKFTSRNNNSAQYNFAPGDVGAEVLISGGYENKSAVPQGSTTNTLPFELFGGGIGQPIWPYMLNGSASEPAYPGAALGYSGLAHCGFSPMPLGSGAEVPDNTFEVLTPDAYGGGITDCNPVQCIFRVLTDTQQGLGVGPVPFPLSAIDNGTGGTWGGPAGLWGARSVNNTAWNWFAANNFFISPLMTSQDTAASVMSKWLEAGMCAAFMSEGLLKLVPYGDTSAAANGCTWTAPSTYVVALDDTCFITKDGEEPVKITRTAWQDAYNKVQITIYNRQNQYADEPIQEWDQASINRFGERLEDAQDYDFIHTLVAGTTCASWRVKRMTSIRNNFTLTLPFTYSYLEPMDLCTLTTSSTWAGLNNLNLAINNLPVRVTKIEDNPNGELNVTFENYPYGAALPVVFNKGISQGTVPVNLFASPGNAQVVMFEATSRLTGFTGNQIWMGACGTTQNYGTTTVYVSQDGTKYASIGTIEGQARMGVLASTFASGSDPDTTNSLVVDMAENSLPLEAGTTTDADLGTTMCFVDGELISYSAAAVTGEEQVTMNGYIRRGQMGSTISSHAANSLFLRLDASIFKYTYDPTWAGKTVYFKFQAANQFNNSQQDLSTLTAVAFTIPGKNPGTIDASSGLVIATPPLVGAGPLGWTPAA